MALLQTLRLFFLLFSMVHFFSFFGGLLVPMELTGELDLGLDLGKALDKHRVGE